MIEAKVICDSIGPDSPRLTTFQLRYQKFIHGEFMTHRKFSRNASSSRAIPVSKNLEEVRSDALRAAPIYWGAEQKGMQSGEELDDIDRCIDWPSDLPYTLNRAAYALAINTRHELITEREYVKRLWELGSLFDADVAEEMAAHKAHKSIVNRKIEDSLHINVVASSCEAGLLNFFGLRLDKAAQPEIRVLAEAMWREWNESRPQKLVNGQWHLPFWSAVDGDDVVLDKWFRSKEIDPNSTAWDLHCIKTSVARCAHVSYLSFETGKRMTMEKCFEVYERLVGAQPLHASPAEHQATPEIIRYGENWENPHLHGNFPGWIQYRKTLPGEAIAPLPLAYQN